MKKITFIFLALSLTFLGYGGQEPDAKPQSGPRMVGDISLMGGYWLDWDDTVGMI